MRCITGISRGIYLLLKTPPTLHMHNSDNRDRVVVNVFFACSDRNPHRVLMVTHPDRTIGLPVNFTLLPDPIESARLALRNYMRVDGIRAVREIHHQDGLGWKGGPATFFLYHMVEPVVVLRSGAMWDNPSFRDARFDPTVDFLRGVNVSSYLS